MNLPYALAQGLVKKRMETQSGVGRPLNMGEGPDTVEIIRPQHCHGAGDGNAAPLFNVEEAFYKSEPRTSYMLHAESGLFQPVNSPPP